MPRKILPVREALELAAEIAGLPIQEPTDTCEYMDGRPCTSDEATCPCSLYEQYVHSEEDE